MLKSAKLHKTRLSSGRAASNKDHALACDNARTLRQRSQRLQQDCEKTIDAAKSITKRSKFLFEQSRGIRLTAR